MRDLRSYLAMVGCRQVLQLLQCELCQDRKAAVLISAVAWPLWLVPFILVSGFKTLETSPEDSLGFPSQKCCAA